MIIFIGWSGDRAKLVATALRDWLKPTLQYLKPWMSEHDITIGGRWSDELEETLQKAAAGIICLTPENKDNPWILFEAGAISKTVKSKTLVCPFLFDLTKTSLVGPLAQFQMVTSNNKEEIKKMLRDFNAVSGKADAELVEKSFEKWWPDLEEKLQAIPQTPAIKKTMRPQENMIEEILSIVRELSRLDSPGPLLGRSSSWTLAQAPQALYQEYLSREARKNVLQKLKQLEDIEARQDSMIGPQGTIEFKNGSDDKKT